MTWLIWRQHRIEALIIGLFLLAFAILLLVTGINLATTVQQTKTNTDILIYISNVLQAPYFNAAGIILPIVLPVIAGIFIGAPVMAREFEQGTYRLIWTQGVSWRRWFFRKVGLLSCLILCSFGLLFVFFLWWSAPVNATLGRTFIDFSGQFDGWGFVVVAYALFALLLGIFMGTVVRKSVPAMALTLLIFIGVRGSIEGLWRPHFLPPLISSVPMDSPVNVPNGSLMVSMQTLDGQGHAFSEQEAQVCEAIVAENPTQESWNRYHQCVLKHGFQNVVLYQPVDRFWLFQGIESAIYLLLSALLALFTYWWIKFKVVGA